MTDNIYRFMSFPQLVDVVQRSALTLVHPSLWQDPYEGFIFRCLSSPKKKQELIHTLDELYDDVPQLMMLLEVASGMLYAQSWTNLAESDALWRIYSHQDMSVRVEVSQRDIPLLSHEESQEIKLAISEVSYVDRFNLRDEVQETCSQNNQVNLANALRKKRNQFAHEKEVRIHTAMFTDRPSKSKQDDEFMAMAIEKLHAQGALSDEQYQSVRKNQENRKEIDPNIQRFSFAHIDNFIKSVLVHPQAPSWYVDVVETYCKEHNIAFSGKSRLYLLE